VREAIKIDALMSSLQGDLLVEIKIGALVEQFKTKQPSVKGIAAIRKESIKEEPVWSRHTV